MHDSKPVAIDMGNQYDCKILLDCIIQKMLLLNWTNHDEHMIHEVLGQMLLYWWYQNWRVILVFIPLVALQLWK